LAIDKRVDLRGVGGKMLICGISVRLESRGVGATLFRREANLLGVRAIGSGVSKEIKSGIRLLRFFDFLPADFGLADEGVSSSANLIFEGWAGFIGLTSVEPAISVDVVDVSSLEPEFSSDSTALMMERNRADDFRVFRDAK